MTDSTTKELVQQAYCRGYSQGYREGYNDASVDISHGITRTYTSDDILWLPIQELNVSTRAINCLTGAGCKHIRDVVNLDDDQVQYMRRLGTVTGKEIAAALDQRNIKNTAWSRYLFI